MKAAFVQTNPVFGEKNGNIESALKLTRGVDAELTVLPELFNTGYAFASKEEAFDLSEEVPGGPTVSALLEESKTRNGTIVAGIAERAGGTVFNSALVLSKGRLVGRYRKAHLFYKEKVWFSPGDGGFPVFDLGDFRLGVMICFDWAFPEVARILAIKGADIIAHPSNLILPGLGQKAMTIRSLENRLFSITANRVGSEERGGERYRYTGMSQIVSPTMNLLASAGEDETVARVAEMDPRQARDKSITRLNDALMDRRRELYNEIL